MRIAFTSDTHYGHEVLTPSGRVKVTSTAMRAALSTLQPESLDAFAMLGDNGDSTPYGFMESMFAWESCLARERTHKFVIAGNHDLYAMDGLTSHSAFHSRLPELARSANWTWMDTDGSYSVMDGVAIVGSVGWYDYSAARGIPMGNAWYAARKGDYIIDKKYLDTDWHDLFFANQRFLHVQSALQKAQADARVSSIIVLTHVPLFEEQIDRRREWDESSAYFGNLTLGREVQTYDKVQLVVSGHTHSPRSGIIVRDGMRGILTLTLAPGIVAAYDSRDLRIATSVDISEYHELTRWNGARVKQ